MAGGRWKKQQKACTQCVDRCMRVHGGSSSPAAPRTGSHPPPVPLSFFKVMIGNFAESLLVPPKYSATLHYLIDKEVHIEDTNGARWRMEASLLNGSLAFVDGWQEFVMDHGISLGNVVVFKVTGKLISAQIFDLSAWEKLHFRENYDHQLHRPKRKRGRPPSASSRLYHSVRTHSVRTPPPPPPAAVEEEQDCVDVVDHEQSPGRANTTAADVISRASPEAGGSSPGCLRPEKFNQQTLLPVDYYNSSHANGCFGGSNTVSSTGNKVLAAEQADVVSRVLVAEDLGEVLSYYEHGSGAPQTSLKLEFVEAKTDKEREHGLAPVAACSGDEQKRHTLNLGQIGGGVQQTDEAPNTLDFKTTISPRKTGDYAPGEGDADCLGSVGVLSQRMIMISNKNPDALEGSSNHCGEKKDAYCGARQHEDKTDNTYSVSFHSPKDGSFRFSVHVKSLSWQELPSKLSSNLIRKNQARKVFMLLDACNRMWPVLYIRGKEFTGFAAGWQDFARANNLQQGDRCDLELFISHDKILKVLLNRS